MYGRPEHRFASAFFFQFRFFSNSFFFYLLRCTIKSGRPAHI